MSDDSRETVLKWNVSPSAKAKHAVQRSVTALLDELAPERVLRRVELPADAVEQHRTPAGCVLQAADCAVSVSWFSEQAEESKLGELNIVVWRGKVSRRGAPPPRKAATVVAELVLYPIDPPEDNCVWRAADGSRFDSAAVASKCLALLQEQIAHKG
jgi:hypothetical protein